MLDTTPVAIWIAHDPACQVVTGNRYANELLGAPEGTSVSLTPPPGTTVPAFRHFREGRELSADELPLQRAVASGRPVPEVEFEMVCPDGRRVCVPWRLASTTI